MYLHAYMDMYMHIDMCRYHPVQDTRVPGTGYLKIDSEELNKAILPRTYCSLRKNCIDVLVSY